MESGNGSAGLEPGFQTCSILNRNPAISDLDKAALRKARREGKGPKKAKRTKEQAAVVSRKKTFYGEMVADDS